jgi:uncharacterized Tic20 family protein
VLVGCAFSLGFIATAPIQSAPESGLAAGVITLWIAIGAAVLIIFLMSLIFIIMGTLAASEGRPYTYPFAIRFLR